MKRVYCSLVISLLGILATTASVRAAETPNAWAPQLKLLGSVNLPGAFVSPQMVYADSERIFVCSAEGDLFVLERDRETNFQLIETIHLGAPLTAVRGNKDRLFVTSRTGALYTFLKTWPLQLEESVPLSNYGLSSLQVTSKHVYVAKGQGSMIATDDRIYLTQMNPGDFVVELPTMQSYGQQFTPGSLLEFDRRTNQFIGAISNPARPGAIINAWQNYVFATNPGCCGAGIAVYNGDIRTPIQFIPRSTNTVAGTNRKGIPLLVGGSESGSVDLYKNDAGIYSLISSVDLPLQTGFMGPEDIEIRALWVDGLDNLIFAASSWGNDRTRGPNLPSFFIIEIRWPQLLSRVPRVAGLHDGSPSPR
jgi:hypothetical protein